MCRHLAYLGDPRPLSEFLFDAPHALRSQGCSPREMVVAKDNPDGWGVAWWTSSNLAPLHYRTTTPMWTDDQFGFSADHAGTLLAAVRKASPNTTLDAVNNAPFVAASRLGALAFSLNGHAFHESCESRVRGALPPETTLAGNTDSEVLFAFVQERIAGGASSAEAIAAVHHVIDPNDEVYVNLLLVTADEIVATTWKHTLYVRQANQSTTVSSEALDSDQAWERVPDASLFVADRAGVTITPLEGLR